MNKIKFGLSNVHYSVIEEVSGVDTFGTPTKIPGAVSLTLTAKGEPSEFYADDMAYFVTHSNEGYDGTLEIALIPDSFRTGVLGDKQDINGALFEDADAIPKRIALMYELKGDANGTRHVNFNVSVSRPDINAETRTDKIDPKTETLKITASPSPQTRYVRAKIKQGQVGYNTFYNNVYKFVESEEPIE